MHDWSKTLTSDLVAEVARIATGRDPELLATSKAAKELDRRLPPPEADEDKPTIAAHACSFPPIRLYGPVKCETPECDWYCSESGEIFLSPRMVDCPKGCGLRYRQHEADQHDCYDS